MINFTKIKVSELSPRGIEAYNYTVAARTLAEYGFECCWLTNDAFGADFLATNQDEVVKIQLKTTVSFSKKYMNKDLWICFPHDHGIWLYKHDETLDAFPNIAATKSWEAGAYHYPYSQLTKKQFDALKGSDHAIYLNQHVKDAGEILQHQRIRVPNWKQISQG